MFNPDITNLAYKAQGSLDACQACLKVMYESSQDKNAILVKFRRLARNLKTSFVPTNVDQEKWNESYKASYLATINEHIEIIKAM